jgi:hypothetical protein
MPPERRTPDRGTSLRFSREKVHRRCVIPPSLACLRDAFLVWNIFRWCRCASPTGYGKRSLLGRVAGRPFSREGTVVQRTRRQIESEWAVFACNLSHPLKTARSSKTTWKRVIPENSGEPSPLCGILRKAQIHPMDAGWSEAGLSGMSRNATRKEACFGYLKNGFLKPRNQTQEPQEIPRNHPVRHSHTIRLRATSPRSKAS